MKWPWFPGLLHCSSPFSQQEGHHDFLEWISLRKSPVGWKVMTHQTHENAGDCEGCYIFNYVINYIKSVFMEQKYILLALWLSTLNLAFLT